MTRFLDASPAILESASDSLSASSRASGEDARILCGTVEEIKEGRSGKDRDWSIIEMCEGCGPM